ncbi:hypothetical protein BDV12DRAFT_124653 [Aspergillus spectabilis]
MSPAQGYICVSFAFLPLLLDGKSHLAPEVFWLPSRGILLIICLSHPVLCLPSAQVSGSSRKQNIGKISSHTKPLARWLAVPGNTAFFSYHTTDSTLLRISQQT